jgi:hypothetical protein
MCGEENDIICDLRPGLIKSDKLKIDTTYTTFKVESEPLLRNLLENVQNSYNRRYAHLGHREGQQEGFQDLGDSRSGNPGLFV